MSRAFTLGLIAVLFAAVALGDVITLDNGKTIRGKIVERRDGVVVIEMDNGGRLTLPSRRVTMVAPDPVEPPPSLIERFLPKPPPEKPPEEAGNSGDGGETAKPPESETPKEPGPDKPAEEKLDPATIRRIAALVEAMGTGEGEGARDTRTQARDALVAMGESAVPAVCEALQDASGWRRQSAAMVLGKIGSRKSAKPLLLAVYLGTPAAGGNVAWWEKEYLDACAQSFGVITGQRFGYEARSSTAGNAAEKMLAWWGQNWKDFPPQVGDKPAPAKEGGEAGTGEEKEPDPVEEIRKMPRRSYAPPANMTSINRGS